MNKQLRSFTLVEMIVVMLLTAIVIGMAYEVFRIVSESYRSFAEKNEKVNDVERLEHWLGRDFLRSEAITAGAGELRMAISGDTVIYRFSDSAVVRQGLKIDSIPVQTSGMQTAFRGIPSPAGAQWVPADELNFTIVLEKQQIPEYFYKLYSAEQLINLTDGIDRHQ
ncbi:type II secretion system protein J [Mucilaginibacter lutimaris]|uniref:Type II secretion system protein J n=1 Tax=Mucilaginibacter lutimaris TaxID=931629 RepID=A0ABW2ZIU0_9SPHI